MKAIRVSKFGGPEELKLENVETPKPGKGQVLVRLHAIGVNPVETYIRSGSNPARTLPYTPGSDGAGTVEALGEGVKEFRSGDRVYTSGSVTGTYAEFAVAEVADTHHLPKQISFAQGAALGVPYATAYRALFQRARAVPAETLLIHGATGGVGMAAVQWAKAAGLTIIATGGTDEGRKLVADQGAHHILDHRAPNYLDEVMALTGGRGVNVILEMLANVNLGKDLPLLARDGRVIIVGSRGKVEITPRDLMSRDADVRGMILFNASAAELTSIHVAIRGGLENATLRPVIGKQMPLTDAQKAHVAIMEPGAHGKMVLIP